MGAAAAEHPGEQLLEVLIDLLKHLRKPLPTFPVQVSDRSSQLGDRRCDLIPFSIDRADLLFDVVGFLFGAQVDRPHVLALFQLTFPAAPSLVFGILRQIRGRIGQIRGGAQPFQDAFGDGAPSVIGLLDATFGPHGILPAA